VIEDEPALRLRIACPARIRGLWRWAVELASRAAGEPLCAWRAAEIIAAEGSAGRPDAGVIGDRALVASMRLAHRCAWSARDNDTRQSEAIQSGTPPGVSASAGTSNVANHWPEPPGRALGSDHRSSLSDSDTTARHLKLTLTTDPPAQPSRDDPFALDARLVEAMRVIRTCESRIGDLLRIVVSHRFYRLLGFRTVEAYVCDRLGISVRKAWALLKLEKATRRGDAFARAYAGGALSWARALALLPVVDRANAEAWVARAQAVTVRRLCDEVSAVLQARDVLGAVVPFDPPALDAPLTSLGAFAKYARSSAATPFGAAVQIGACPAAAVRVAAEIDRERRAAAEICDAEVQFTGPASVVALVRDVLDAFQRPGAPRWTALEALLGHVIDEWERAPRHHDPIFARDGWRCVVPACSSRRNLHDHHLRYRSRQGTNARWNRSSVCAAHHLHGIHKGAIRAYGRAPDAIRWELGVRIGAPPLLEFIGDRLYAPTAAQETPVALAT
jgi:hypothetical protein